MSIANIKDSGNQGNNMPWQWKMLQGIQAIADATSTPLTCVDQVTVCGTTFTDIEGVSALNVNVINPIPLEVIINEVNDSIQIYASDGSNNVPVLVGQQPCSDSLAVSLCTQQAQVYVTPVLLASTTLLNPTGNLTAYSGTQILSISFANNGTADADVSVDGGVNYLKLAPGMTINLDANGIMNYYNPNLFYWDTSITAGASLLIAFNFV